MKPWDILERKELLDASPYLKLYRETVQLENGEIVDDYYTIDQRDFTVIFAMVSALEILCVRHYKHGAKRINLGLPAGYIEDGEAPLSAAQRELLEETGYSGKEWQPLGTFVVDGNRGCGNVHVFFASGLVKIQEPDPDDLEVISLEKISLKKLPELLADGEVSTLGAAIGIALGILHITLKAKSDA
jgi:ADP-ribose pyrophosphatase